VDRDAHAPARALSGTVARKGEAGRRLAVVGGGWAGLAAAVRATEAGAAVTLFEMAGQLGGRARSVAGSAPAEGAAFDNGQHILIGAYTRTLDLMRSLGVETGSVLARQPLTLRTPDGRGLALPPGPPLPAFVRAVAACRGWTWGDRLALLVAAGGWAARGFRCAPELTVGALCRRLPARVRALLIDPLCVAALNTPADQASAAVFLRVLRDALFSGPGSADLLLPRQPLGALLPEPAITWLKQRGAGLRLGTRVQTLQADGAGWRVDGEAFDAVVLACTATEAARLVASAQGTGGSGGDDWPTRARALRYEPIVTVLLHWPGARLASSMTALVEGPDAPAQFAFDHGAVGATPGRFAFVISGAQPWVDAGAEATAAAVLRQAAGCFAEIGSTPAPEILSVLAEKRATFRCTPGLDRPPAAIAPGLWAAGDYVEGPYPATLEGAVRAGEAAVRHALA
jgi:squalene-associated FAD-dependent desaturase